MIARSRPRARIAALKPAARFAPEAEMITSATAPVPIPTAAGWVRRQRSDDERRDPDHDGHDAQPRRVLLPRVGERGGADHEREQVDHRVDDAVAAAALLVGGVDHDAGQRRAHPAGQPVGEACCRCGRCHRAGTKARRAPPRRTPYQSRCLPPPQGAASVAPRPWSEARPDASLPA